MKKKIRKAITERQRQIEEGRRMLEKDPLEKLAAGQLKTIKDTAQSTPENERQRQKEDGIAITKRDEN